jgi:hypothetical protein
VAHRILGIPADPVLHTRLAMLRDPPPGLWPHHSKMGVSEDDLNRAERIFLEAAAVCNLR